MWTIEKAGGRRAGSGRERGNSRFPLASDPARRPLAFSIVFTDREPGTGYENKTSVVILVPRAHDPSGLWQRSRALARPDFLSVRRVFVSYSQPIRFARFDGKSVNRGLPVLELSITTTGQKDRGL